MEWIGYPGKINEWIPFEMLNCEELLFDFEKSRLKHIVGAKIVPNGFEYVIILNDYYAFEPIPANKTLKMWPNELIDFSEIRIVFEMPDERHAHSPEVQLSRNLVTISAPCATVNNKICYL